MRTAHQDHRHLEIATAVGGALVVVFWVVYFLANETIGLVDPANAHFEESFIVADAVFATLLFATSWSLRLRATAGPFLLAMAASMSLYLGILDATYYARQGLFPITDTALVVLLIQGLCVGGGLYGLWAAWHLWSAS